MWISNKLIHPGANVTCVWPTKHVIMKTKIRKKYSTWRNHKYACHPAELCTYICAVFIHYISFLITFIEHSIGHKMRHTISPWEWFYCEKRSGTKVHIAVKDDNPGQNKKGIILIKRVKWYFFDTLETELKIFFFSKLFLL